MNGHVISVELSPLSVTQKKQLEAACEKLQKRILGICWKDEAHNDESGRDNTAETRTRCQERSLRWFGHVL